MAINRLPSLLSTTFLTFGLLSFPILNNSLAADGVLSDASVVTYQPVYFEKFNPVTLLDMLQRIPGVQEVLNKNRSGREQRGFGNGGDQILIDGKRLAGKSNNINDALSRISANQIAQIDLIRGAASGLDVQSQGLVINIKLVEGASKSTTFWRVMGEYTFGYKVLPQFLVSHNGTSGNLEYTVALERRNDRGYRPSEELFFDGDDNSIGAQSIDHEFHFKGWKVTSGLGYSFDDGAELRLNGLFEPNGFTSHEERIETGDEPDSLIWDRNSDNDRWEIGGDYNRNLGFLGQSKTLFVINRNTEDTDVSRLNNFTAPEYIYATEDTNTARSEKIFRSSVTPTIATGQTLELGGEVAINTFDKTFIQFGRDAALDPLLLDNISDVNIRENRYEVFAIHSYNINESIVLQSSLTTEFSKIIADNNFVDGTIDTRDTSLTYFKPRMNLRYDFTDVDQFRATVEKKVSQLRFDSFVTSYDAQNDELKVGNTDLLPTQTWEFILAYEHRLPNDTGTIEAQTYYHHRIDHQTRIDFTDYVDFDGNPIGVDDFFALPPDMDLRDSISFTPTQGNIASAYIYGVDLKSNLRMGFLGVPEATVTLGYRYEKRRSMDQFTQMMRDFARHSDHEYTVNFRHDVVKWQLAYGLDMEWSSDRANYDMRYFQPQSPAANLKAFVEYNINNGIKARVDVLEITGKNSHQTTYRYNDHIRFNELTAREERENTRPRAIQMSLQGSF